MSPVLACSRVVGWGIFALTCVLVGVGGWLGASGGRGGQPEDATLALAFTLTGALILNRRPSALGWLASMMALSGVAYAADSYHGWALRHEAAGGEWAAWVASWVWAPSSLSLVTVLLLLVPTGRLPSRRWRPLLIGVWLATGAYTVAAALMPSHDEAGAGGPAFTQWAVPAQHLLPVALAALLFLALGCLAGLVLRVRRSRGVARLQLVWICAGGVVTVATTFGNGVLPDGWATAVQAVGVLALPACLGVAVLRHNLYDVDPVLRRSLTYTLLVVAILTVALGLTAIGGLIFGAGRPTVTVLTTIVIALLVNPLYRRMRRAVDRMLYGRRGDPYRVLADLSRRLSQTADPQEVLTAVVDAAARTVRSPYVRLDVAGGLLEVARGDEQPFASDISLTYQGSVHGRLRLAPRAPGEPFDPRDRQLLADVAAQASAAVYAAVTELDLRAARDRLVRTREDERRRLRRDLHDGVGPVLAGLGFTAAAAARALPDDPDRASRLLCTVHQQAATAVATVRRISRDLQPQPLAELGLIGALHQLGEPLAKSGIEWSAAVPVTPVDLPAAVEVAVYHVAAEAIANAVRHSGARSIAVAMNESAGRVTLHVSDDGVGIAADAPPGIGLASMRTRAEELGGRLAIESAAPHGTRISLLLPVPRQA
jgi:two-component system NarL family sensor kinase